MKLLGSFILLLLSISFAFAYTSFTGVPNSYDSVVRPDIHSYYSGADIQSYWPVLNNPEQCLGRQDILIQVSPAGCQPAVVRSDLLAEQNVPVFCQLDALTLNPLLDVKSIDTITFSGDYPEGIIGTGFHPARAALRSYDRLLGDPIINNIGYLVVVLKKQSDESKLPGELNATLQARIRYKADNVLGVGRTEFLLKEQNERQWSEEKNKNSFWNGRFFVRLESADANSATLSFYQGDKRISSVKVNKGTTSKEFYLPGSYCQMGLSVAYDGFVPAERSARVQVDDEVFEVTKGMKILGDCRVNDILNNSQEDKLRISCSGKNYELALNRMKYSIGDVVERNGFNWTITKIDSENNQIKYYLNKTISGVIGDEQESTTEELKIISSDRVFDRELDGEVKKNYEQSMFYYMEVAEIYGNERDNSLGQSYGEQALASAMELSISVGKERAAAEIAERLLSEYPNTDSKEAYGLVLNSLKSGGSIRARSVVNVNGESKVITLLGIKEPSNSEKSRAYFNWGASSDRIEIASKDSRKIEGVGEIVLESLNVDNARVSFRCEDGAISGNERKTGTESFRLGDSGKSVCGQTLVLDDIVLGEQVKIRILPKAKNLEVLTNVSVIVGIEKRALKLTPDKAKERIEELNKTIKKWEGISNNLGNTVKGLKTACFATAGVLTVKNFLTGLNGEGIARQKVMRDYWNVKCAELVNAGDYSSVGECYYHKTNEINSDVAAVQRAIEAENTKIKSIESDFDESVEGIGGVFGEKNVDSEKAASKFAEQEIVGVYGDEMVNGQKLGDLIDEQNGYKNGEYTYGQLTEMKLNLDIAKDNSGASEGLKEAARERLDVIGKAIKDQKELVSEYSAAKSEENGGVPLSTGVLGGKGDNRGDNYVVVVDREAVSDGRINSKIPGDGSVTHVAKVFVKNSLVVNSQSGQEVNLDAGQYVLLLKKEGNNYLTKEVYRKESSGELVNIAEKQDLFLDQYNLGSVKPIDEISYNNVYLNPKLRYYETEPFKGMPAIVPFNKQQGWYAATKQTLPGFGGIGAFDSSGRVAVLWVCNVGANGIEQFFEGVGDDTCVQVNLNSGQAVDQFPGMGEEQARRLILQARDAVQEASQKYKQGLKVVQIRGETFEVGSPAANIPSSQCQNYMSPEECRLLFNVCDPVICPSSRCDFGGAYPVPDVIQTGIVGSALLCLPNFNEGVYIPVCLTGIKAGIDGYLSILKSHQLCLQENIDSGKYVGICDEISAVYACEFFWRQAAPLANVALPKLVELASGQIAPRGGGEYLTTQAAWQNTQESINYFTQTYAVNSLEAFKIRSVEEAGSTFCKAFISAKGPKTFEALIEPDSPAQFHAWFSSTPYTSATVPATSQYKVFYHIYSGNDVGVNYVVYLKDPPETSYYQSTQTITVASGFAPKGQFATETKDFTAPEGYKQLCVRINNKEECGFKQVSTSFAVDQLRDGFAKDEITRSDIKTEASCISGGALSGSGNVGALLQPNIQAGAEEFAFGQTYDRGIVRICATSNPGSDTDPTRFVEVGYCGDVKIRCWLDSKSADNAITENNIGVRNATIVELEKIQEDTLVGNNKIDRRDFVSENIKVLNGKVDALKKSDEPNDNVVQEIDTQLDRTFFNHQKARLILLKAKVYDIIVQKLLVARPIVLATDESAFFEGDSDERVEDSSNRATDESVFFEGDSEVLTISDFYFRGNVLFFKEGANGLYIRGSGSSVRFYYDINGNSVNVAKLTNGLIELVPLSSENSGLISEEAKEHLEFLKGKRYSDIEKLPAGEGIQVESSS